MAKLYGLDSSLIHDAKPNEGFVIDMVRASDYLELERQRDALVAENVALKEANSKLVKEQQASWPIGLLESFLSEHDPRTPATDAALREIGAKAVEKFAEQQSKLAIEYSKLSSGCRDAKELAENALMAREFAQQLREGKA